MGFFEKNRTAINVVLVLSEITNILIAVVVNVVTRETFDILSTHNIIMCGILVFLVIAHSIFGIIQHNVSQKVRNKRFLKAFSEHGGYDLVAEEAKECIRSRDYRSMKDLKKMVELVER